MVQVQAQTISVVLALLGFMAPQSFVPSDPTAAAGNGEWAAPAAARLVPAGPDVFLMLNTGPEARAALSRVWLAKLTRIGEINRVLGKNAASPRNRKAWVLAQLVKVCRQVWKLEPAQAAVGVYLDEKKKSVRVVGAATCGKMETLEFFITTAGVLMEWEDWGTQFVTTRRGAWTVITFQQGPREWDFAVAVSGSAVVCEWVSNGTCSYLERIVAGTAAAVTARNGGVAQAVRARGDSRNVLFFTADAGGAARKVAAVDTATAAADRLFGLQNLGRVVYAVTPEGKVFKETFSMLGGTGKGLFAELVGCSAPFDPDVLALVPREAVYVQAGGFRVKDALALLVSGLKRNPETAEAGRKVEEFFTASAENGVDVRGKVIMPMEETGVFAMVLPPRAGMPPGAVCAVKTTDATSIMDILDLVQNENFTLARREIGGVPARTAQVKGLPFLPTFGAVAVQGKTFFVVTSSPDTFLSVVRARDRRDGPAFAPAPDIALPPRVLLFQYCNVRKTASFAYPVLQAALPVMARNNPVLADINAAAMPSARELFGDAPPFVGVTTARKGTVLSSPFPGMRILSGFSALLPVLGFRLAHQVNAPVEQERKKEKEFERLKKKMEKGEVDIF